MKAAATYGEWGFGSVNYLSEGVVCLSEGGVPDDTERNERTISPTSSGVSGSTTHAGLS